MSVTPLFPNSEYFSWLYLLLTFRVSVGAFFLLDLRCLNRCDRLEKWISHRVRLACTEAVKRKADRQTDGKRVSRQCGLFSLCCWQWSPESPPWRRGSPTVRKGFVCFQREGPWMQGLLTQLRLALNLVCSLAALSLLSPSALASQVQGPVPTHLAWVLS